jgi:3-hydroxybutyryl-CoA dehydrogenase
MFSASVRSVARVGSSITSRSFSTSTAAYAAEVKSLGVIGAGQMVSMLLYCNFSSGQILSGLQGLGIALVAASKAQVPVTLIDNSQASLDKGLTFAGMLDTVQLSTTLL